MNALVLYDSKFGNTEQIAEEIALALQEEVPTRLASVDEIEDYGQALWEVDLLVVGGPTHRHGVSDGVRTVVECLDVDALGGLLTATFDTRLRGAKIVTGSAAVRVSRLLRRRGAWVVVPPASFIVDGREGPLHDGEREHARAWAQEVLSAVGVRARTAHESVAG
ncbi:MAG TPA: flavodoxin domain-containing protein [Gaiellaceae bacterium]|nr:flavodoxin domain-containing protein [Gaiellaceae bacterium]